MSVPKCDGDDDCGDVAQCCLGYTFVRHAEFFQHSACDSGLVQNEWKGFRPCQKTKERSSVRCVTTCRRCSIFRNLPTKIEGCVYVCACVRACVCENSSSCALTFTCLPSFFLFLGYHFDDACWFKGAPFLYTTRWHQHLKVRRLTLSCFHGTKHSTLPSKTCNTNHVELTQNLTATLDFQIE